MASASPKKIRASKARSTASIRKRSPKSKFDHFFTRDDEAVRLYGVFREHFDPSDFLLVEPSAGAGAFFKLMSAGSLGYDVVRQFPGVVEADFLDVTLPGGRPVAVVGNPPYGRNAKTAVSHFNHAARQPDVAVIAMVLPRSFRKASVENRLNRSFHLLREAEVPRDAFTFGGKPFKVGTVFQIWVRLPVRRQLKIVETTHPDFEFTTPGRADIVVQRVGARAGRVHDDFTASPNSHYFIRGDVEAVMRGLDFATAAANATGNPSLAKSEIVALYRISTGSTAVAPIPVLSWQTRRLHVRGRFQRDGHRRRRLDQARSRQYA